MTEHTARQQEVLEAAVRLIAEGGIRKCTIRNLAERIGFTEPAVYRHFKNKNAILLAVLDLFAANSAGHLAEAARQAPGPDTILNFLADRFADFSARPAFAAVIFSEEHFRSDRRLTSKVQAIMEDHRAAFTDLIRRGQEAGRLRGDAGADELFLAVFGAFRLLVKQWNMAATGFDLRERGHRLISSLRILLTPSATSLKE